MAKRCVAAVVIALFGLVPWTIAWQQAIAQDPELVLEIESSAGSMDSCRNLCHSCEGCNHVKYCVIAGVDTYECYTQANKLCAATTARNQVLTAQKYPSQCNIGSPTTVSVKCEWDEGQGNSCNGVNCDDAKQAIGPAC